MAIQIAIMGAVFTLIFKVDSNIYVPYLAVSLVLWTYISTTISESCTAFVNSESLIKQVKLPLIVHVLRSWFRNIVIAAHNFVIIPIVLIFFGVHPSVEMFALIPGFGILALNLLWISAILGIFSARYRDVPSIVSSALTVLFYVSPVMWLPSLLGNDRLAHLLLGLNPLYHLLQIARLPILGESATFENWIISASLAIAGLALAWIVLDKTKTRLAYWI
jgi:lipopolysaccharide transport system permease protein